MSRVVHHGGIGSAGDVKAAMLERAAMPTEEREIQPRGGVICEQRNVKSLAKNCPVQKQVVGA